jgi:hypothetical protein
MKHLLFLTCIALPTVATTIINQSSTDVLVTFSYGTESSPACMLGPNKRIDHQEAFGKGYNATVYASLSARIQLINPAISIDFNNLDLNASVEFTFPEFIQTKTVVINAPVTWSQTCLKLLGHGIYFGSLAALAPTGAAIFSGIGAKLGGAIGIKIIQQSLSTAHPLVSIFSPLLITNGNSMGIAGGYALGAATGSLLLPISFAAGWHIAEALFTWALTTDEKIEIKPVEPDCDWILLEKPQAFSESFIEVEPRKTSEDLSPDSPETSPPLEEKSHPTVQEFLNNQYAILKFPNEALVQSQDHIVLD